MIIYSFLFLFFFEGAGGGAHLNYFGIQGVAIRKNSDEGGVIIFYRSYPSNPTNPPYKKVNKP